MVGIGPIPGRIFEMAKPEFHPKHSSGTWFVAVATGHGPESHIGDFLTEEDARHWTSTKSKYWPSKPVTPNNPQPQSPQPAHQQRRART
jgi:hypothetical protein